MANTEINVMYDLQDGDLSSFEKLVAKHEKTVFNIVYRFLGRTSDADDIAQEVFLRIWRSAHRYKPTAQFTTYLYRITANLCLSNIRRRKRHNIISLETATRGKGTTHHMEMMDENEAEPAEKLGKEEMAEKVRDALTELPENQSMAVILRRYEDLSYKEIAEVMNSSVPAVKSLLSRAREKLREKLEPFM